MTDIVHPASLMSGTASRVRQLAARFGRSLCAIVLARATRRALSGLPDDVLKDIGLTRGEIPFIAGAIARGDAEASRDSLGARDEAVTLRVISFARTAGRSA